MCLRVYFAVSDVRRSSLSCRCFLPCFFPPRRWLRPPFLPSITTTPAPAHAPPRRFLRQQMSIRPISARYSPTLSMAAFMRSLCSWRRNFSVLIANQCEYDWHNQSRCYRQRIFRELRRLSRLHNFERGRRFYQLWKWLCRRRNDFQRHRRTERFPRSSYRWRNLRSGQRLVWQPSRRFIVYQ